MLSCGLWAALWVCTRERERGVYRAGGATLHDFILFCLKQIMNVLQIKDYYFQPVLQTSVVILCLDTRTNPNQHTGELLLRSNLTILIMNSSQTFIYR